jgi:hypothetical protein
MDRVELAKLISILTAMELKSNLIEIELLAALNSTDIEVMRLHIRAALNILGVKADE